MRSHRAEGLQEFAHEWNAFEGAGVQGACELIALRSEGSEVLAAGGTPSALQLSPTVGADSLNHIVHGVRTPSLLSSRFDRTNDRGRLLRTLSLALKLLEDIGAWRRPNSLWRNAP